MNSKAIITSALPYANGEIHLGHVASTYLPADVTTRFLRQKGVEAYYICASDDFGTHLASWSYGVDAHDSCEQTAHDGPYCLGTSSCRGNRKCPVK